LAEHLAWPGLKQVCRLERTTICKGKQTTEVQYAISSAAPSLANANLLMARWQSHWGIESLHWIRDVTFGEDKCQVKVGHAPQNLAAFRNAAISLLRVTGHPEIAASLRGFSYQPLKLLKFLGIMKH
jgi:predicted transposase YbfD/YdcC